jgi:hypothetical protein
MQLRSTLITITAGVALLASSAACNEVDIVVARAGLTPEGGPGGSCDKNSDCTVANTYCAKSSCTDTQPGTCTPGPLDCGDAGFSPVCGCDGVTYANDCLRTRAGVPALMTPAGACGAMSALCGGPQDASCPGQQTVCNYLTGRASPQDCSGGPQHEGTCWVLPFQCPLDAGPQEWQQCSVGPQVCVDLCAAIQSGRRYFLARGPCY